MQVEATFSELPAAPLELRMSRSSPGRYSLHDFAKNVYDVHAFGRRRRRAGDRSARRVRVDRPCPRRRRHGEVQGLRRSRRRHLPGHRPDARAHQHAGGDHVGAGPGRSAGDADVHDRRPARAGRSRRSCIQGATPFEFTAPNLPVPDGQPDRVRARCSSRSSPSGRDVPVRRAPRPAPTPSWTGFVQGRREDRPPGGGRSSASIPAYEPGYYTFLADYLPYATADGMEHRNSTVITAPASIAQRAARPARHRRARVLPLLERRADPPARLEPFDFDRAQHVG